jgi:recombination protein RecT
MEQNAIKQMTDSTISTVIEKVELFKSGGLKLPKDYDAQGSMRLAFLMIQEVKDMNKQPALSVCTQVSVANALLEMVIKGLNPSKNQCYFIVYGNKLVMQDSYLGKLAQAKRVAGIKHVIPFTLFEGDIFEWKIDYLTGRKSIVNHETQFANQIQSKWTGAFAIKVYESGETDIEVMAKDEIIASWQMGKAKGNSPAHKNFPGEMAKKTVSNRCVKIDIGSSDDANLFIGEEDDIDLAGANVDNIIEQNANKHLLELEVTTTENEDDKKKIPNASPEEAFKTPEDQIKKEEAKAGEQLEIKDAKGPGFAE